MIEIPLVLVIITLCVLLAFQDRESRKERKSLMNAIIAKSSEELANLELADKTNIDVKTPDVQDDGLPSDAVPMSEINDDDFMRAIRNPNGNTE